MSKEGRNMASVDIGIGHDDDLVIAKTVSHQTVHQSHTKGLNHSDNFFVGKHFIEASTLGVEHLPRSGKDRSAFCCRGPLWQREPAAELPSTI